ncbi:MFS multidrug transporter [Colletotrichum plurivorum]|uniref:MFS multidrug transporter n=1 Tax=Colletotrichum plurivorum TaxID=2175906 RepID=A0A8H6NAG6_9PEZI|nr:MFS multidrug transporter [Colletotrichum plurivorum]
MPPRAEDSPRQRPEEPYRDDVDDDADTESNAESEDLGEDTPILRREVDTAAASGDPAAALEAAKPPEKPRPVSWRDLPQKQQLLVITLTRLSEPLVQTSLQSYMFYQLKYFSPTLPDSAISAQAGVLHASFTALQFVTAMMWGRLADSKRFGRKTVLMIGLLGTCVSCIGFGFSRTFAQALFFRCLGGATNGNVGVLRTMISEIVREKKYQARAFILLPMTFNIGVIIGPILGGLLSDPAGSYPDLFGGVPFFEKFPYATPNLLSAVFLFCAACSVWLCLDETLDALRERGPDAGSRAGAALASALRKIWSRIRHGRRRGAIYLDESNSGGESYAPSTATTDVEMSPDAAPTPKTRPRARYTQRLPFRRIFTRNVALTFSAHFLLAFHVGTFNSLWFVFLSTPASQSPPHLPFRFSGGLGMPPRNVGAAMAVLGFIGISLQLFVYPRLSARLGTVRAWRVFLCMFPLAYFFVPYLAVVPSNDFTPPGPKGGGAVWTAIVGVLLVQVLGRTFALPGQTILINNCSPHPSVLGTVHGLGQSVSSAARTVGPVLGGFLYGKGLEAGVVGAVWWGLAGVAVLGVLASLAVWEGDGHEIWLEGDEEEEERR